MAAAAADDAETGVELDLDYEDEHMGKRAAVPGLVAGSLG